MRPDIVFQNIRGSTDFLEGSCDIIRVHDHRDSDSSFRPEFRGDQLGGKVDAVVRLVVDAGGEPVQVLGGDAQHPAEEGLSAGLVFNPDNAFSGKKMVVLE